MAETLKPVYGLKMTRRHFLQMLADQFAFEDLTRGSAMLFSNPNRLLCFGFPISSCKGRCHLYHDCCRHESGGLDDPAVIVRVEADGIILGESSKL